MKVRFWHCLGEPETDDVLPCDTEPYDWRVDWRQVLADLRMQDQMQQTAQYQFARRWRAFRDYVSTGVYHEPETDDQLDCRNVNPIFNIKPQPAPQPSDPRSEGIARALRRLCDGAEWRMGCADYEPER